MKKTWNQKHIHINNDELKSSGLTTDLNNQYDVNTEINDNYVNPDINDNDVNAEINENNVYDHEYAKYVDNFNKLEILYHKYYMQNTLLGPKDNPIRDLVRESRDVEEEVDKKVELEYRNNISKSETLLSLEPRLAWEVQNSKFNSKLWTPNNRNLKITNDLTIR